MKGKISKKGRFNPVPPEIQTKLDALEKISNRKIRTDLIPEARGGPGRCFVDPIHNCRKDDRNQRCCGKATADVKNIEPGPRQDASDSGHFKDRLVKQIN